MISTALLPPSLASFSSSVSCFCLSLADTVADMTRHAPVYCCAHLSSPLSSVAKTELLVNRNSKRSSNSGQVIVAERATCSTSLPTQIALRLSTNLKTVTAPDTPDILLVGVVLMNIVIAVLLDEFISTVERCLKEHAPPCGTHAQTCSYSTRT